MLTTYGIFPLFFKTLQNLPNGLLSESNALLSPPKAFAVQSFRTAFFISLAEPAHASTTFLLFFFLNKKNQTHAYSHLGQLDSDLQLRYWGGDIKQVCSTCFPSLETIHSRDQEREITFISSTVRCLQDSRDMRSWLVLRWHSQEVTQQEFSQRWTWALPSTQQKSKTEETSRVLSGSTSSAIAVFHTIQIYTISQKTTKSQNSLKNGKHLLTSRVIYTKCCSLQLPQAMKSW